MRTTLAVALILVAGALATPVASAQTTDLVDSTFGAVNEALNCATGGGCGTTELLDEAFRAINEILNCATGECAEPVIQALREIIDQICRGSAQGCVDVVVRIVEQICGGSVNGCDDRVNDLVQQTCGGPAIACVNNVMNMIDSDGDRVPDAVESAICGRAVVRNAVNGAAAGGQAGKCPTTTNYVLPGIPSIPPIPVLPPVPGDGDGDRIPDAVEPYICLVEDENTSADGSCSGGNYTP